MERGEGGTREDHKVISSREGKRKAAPDTGGGEGKKETRKPFRIYDSLCAEGEKKTGTRGKEG